MYRREFLEGMSRAACTVSIVTTDGVAGRAGVTVSAMTSVSADTPEPTLLVCVHHQSAAAPAIATNGVFCVNVLRDEHLIISDIFAGRGRTASGNKFDCAEWQTLKTGAPALLDPIVAFDCRLMQQFRFGTHWVFVGLLDDIVISHPGAPLVYANRAYGVPVPMEQARSKSIVHRGTSSPTTVIEIGYYVTLGASFLPAVVSGFRAENPRSRVTLLEADQDRLKSALRNRAIELAFTYDLELGEDYERILLGEVPPYVLLPANHKLCAQTRISLESLVEEPMVLLDIAPSRDYFCSLFGAVGKVPKVEHRSRSFEMVRGMVGHGFGYALLATKPSNNMTYDGMLLTTRPLLEDVAPSRFVICHMSAHGLSAGARAFVGFCSEFFRSPQSVG
jgi:flavin reductase (DIM6/NTAB) family NADH-FMN oxidoreductase RutF/DNA-binding transcriptional LysR family regulator